MIDPKQAQLCRAIKGQVSDSHAQYLKQQFGLMRQRIQANLQQSAAWIERQKVSVTDRRRQAVDIVARNRAERENKSFEQAKDEVIAMAEPAYNHQDDK